MRQPLVGKKRDARIVQTGMPDGFMGFMAFQRALYSAFEKALAMRRQQAIARDVKQIIEENHDDGELDIRTTEA